MENKSFLGANLQKLREGRDETLQQVGDQFCLSRSAIKDYETERRTPTLQTLKKMASYYDITVDELINKNLPEQKNVKKSTLSIKKGSILLQKAVPLFPSEEGMKNQSFKKAYKLSRKIIDATERGEILRGSIITESLNLYLDALEECELMEAAANALWSIFIWWSCVGNTAELLELQKKLLRGEISTVEASKEINNLSPETKEKRKEFVAYIDDLVHELLRVLMSDSAWIDFGDYYLALRYATGMVNTEFSDEMNHRIGEQWLGEYMLLGNKYIKSFCEEFEK